MRNAQNHRFEYQSLTYPHRLDPCGQFLLNLHNIDGGVFVKDVFGLLFSLLVKNPALANARKWCGEGTKSADEYKAL